MSNQAMTWAFAQSLPRPAQKLVLLALANFANSEGCSYPSVATITELATLDRKTVISALDALEAGGYIADTGERKGQTASVKVYRLSVPVVEEKLCKHCNKSKVSQKRDTLIPVSSPKNGTPSTTEAVPLLEGSSTAFDDSYNILELIEPVEREEPPQPHAKASAPLSVSSSRKKGKETPKPIPLPENWQPDTETLDAAKADRVAAGRSVLPEEHYRAFLIAFRRKNQEGSRTLAGWNALFCAWYLSERVTASSSPPALHPSSRPVVPIPNFNPNRKQSASAMATGAMAA